jgi:hypothetical protein
MSLPDSSDIDNALVAKLGADATLLALLPNGAYMDEAPPGATRFVIVSLVEAPDEPEFGRRAYEEPLYLVKAVALSSSGGDVKAGAARLDVLLEDATLTVAGYAPVRLCREDRIRMTEVDAVDASIRWFHRGGHYRALAAAAGT